MGWGTGNPTHDALLSAISYMIPKVYGKYKSKPKSSVRLVTRRRRPSSRGGKRKGRKRSRRQTRSNIPKRVRTLEKRMAEDTGVHTERFRDTASCVASANSSCFEGKVLINSSRIESVISGLHFFDVNTPGTLATVDMTLGTFQKDIRIANVYGKLTARNNYQTPVICDVYVIRCKSDTSIEPSTAYTNGLTDVGAPLSTSTMVFPTDSPQFNDLWDIVKHRRWHLDAGQECSLGCNMGGFVYDPSLFDSHGLSYQTSFKGSVIYVRVQGVIAHDNTISTEQGLIKCGVDYKLDSTWTVKYPAGADINYIKVNDNGDAFSNGPVVSNKPLADNQAWSLA